MMKNTNRSLSVISTLYCLSLISPFVTWAQYPSVINVTDLDGSNGFTVNGVNPVDWLGYQVSHAGDINNDGIDDFMASSVFDDENNDNAGAVYVIFGNNQPWPATFDLTTLNGSNGFKLVGDKVGDHAGYAINSAGDINHDGNNDIVITAESHGSGKMTFNGATYVVFGAPVFPASIDLSSLDGSNGFVMYGRFSGDQASSADGAGDFNGDGIDDLIMGHQAHDPGMTNAGAIYVIYGKNTNFSSELDLNLIDGSNGIVFYGESEGDIAGTEVQGVGDFNDDGVDDILISATRRGTNGVDSGTVYLVFGHPTQWLAVNQLSDLNGANGAIINGVATRHFFGLAIDGGGDFNADGIDDLLISAQIIEANRQDNYLILGRTSALAAEQDITAIADLTVQTGTTDFLGSPHEYSIAFAGDVNGDGMNDMLIGDYQNSNINNTFTPGAAYLVFGHRVISSPIIDAASMPAQVGFVIQGDIFDGWVGASVRAAGDMNADDVADFLVGGPFVDNNGTNSGSAYVVFGNDVIFQQGFE